MSIVKSDGIGIEDSGFSKRFQSLDACRFESVTHDNNPKRSILKSYTVNGLFVPLQLFVDYWDESLERINRDFHPLYLLIDVLRR